MNRQDNSNLVNSGVVADTVVVPREVPFEIVFKRLVDNKIVSSRSDLARLLGFGRAAVTYIASKRGTTPPEWERRFEDAGFCWRWVATGEGPIYNPHSIMTQGKMAVATRIIGLKDGEAVISDRDIDLPLHTNYLRMIGVEPSQRVAYFVIQGDAMAPTLAQGDICLVNLDSTAVDTGQYFLLQFANGIIGVRKMMILGADIMVAHDNPQYPAVPFVGESTVVIGRVLAALKKL
jgi:hypothetical protein